MTDEYAPLHQNETIMGTGSPTGIVEVFGMVSVCSSGNLDILCRLLST